MLFRKSAEVPAKIREAKIESWYSKLGDQDRMKLSRYLESADGSSHYAFFSSTTDAALADENPKFAVTLCEQAYGFELTDYQKFCMNERLIEAYIGAARYDDVKAACAANFDMFPSIRDELVRENGCIPKKLNFRNRYIDIIVGVDSSYDLAFEMLEKYNKMGILDDDELQFRVNSLKTHRLQRVFDGVYSYRPANEDR